MAEDTPASSMELAAHGPAATIITATGEGLDAAEFERLLVSCQLTDEELAAGGHGLHDPFGLSPLAESTAPEGSAG